jgi:hypothetical protein
MCSTHSLSFKITETAEIVEESGIDDKDWGLVYDNDTELCSDRDAVVDFGEAKQNGVQNDGYTYKKEDSKPGRKTCWLW